MPFCLTSWKPPKVEIRYSGSSRRDYWLLPPLLELPLGLLPLELEPPLEAPLLEPLDPIPELPLLLPEPPLELPPLELPELLPEPPLELPLLPPKLLLFEPAFTAASNSLRLIWPLPSASARLKSRPGTAATSERSR